MIGKRISPILKEIEETLWDYQANVGTYPCFTEDGFKGAVKIFVDVMMDRMWRLQCNENMSLEDKSKMATKLGNEIRSLIKTYTDIDTHELYKTKKP